MTLLTSIYYLPTEIVFIRLNMNNIFWPSIHQVLNIFFKFYFHSSPSPHFPQILPKDEVELGGGVGSCQIKCMVLMCIIWRELCSCQGGHGDTKYFMYYILQLCVFCVCHRKYLIHKFEFVYSTYTDTHQGRSQRFKKGGAIPKKCYVASRHYSKSAYVAP